MLAREMESDYSRVGASGNRSRVSHAAAPVLIGAALLLGLASVGIMRQQVVAALHSPAQCNVRDTTRCEHVNAVCAQAALSSLQEQLAEQLRAQQTLLSASMSASHKKEAAPWAKFLPPSMKEKEEERMEEIFPLMSKLPAKYVIPYVTPSSDQANRGDCWLFATAGILESSYIHYGATNGYLDGTKFLRLSRQALGIALMEECKKNPTSMCPINKVVGSDSNTPGHGPNITGKPKMPIRFADTTEGEGGSDDRLMSHYPNVGKIGPIPDSICKYEENQGYDIERVCPGLMQYRKVNPLEFKINRIHDYATSADIKAALVRSGRPLALGVTETNSAFYFPCTAAYSCPGNGKPIVNCPNDPVYKDYSSCFTDGKSMVSMKGEWFVKANGAPMGQAGGHAINIVGYNDFHRDEWGNTGGFILRNTWKDGKAGHGLMAVGSHSWKFFAHMVDEDDEKYSCPNPANPRSWTECADLEACKHDIDGDVLEGPPKTYRELMCINTGQIKYLKSPCNDKTSYWLKNRTDWGSEGLFVSCFVTEAGGKAGDVCLPPLTLDDLATIFFPVDNTKDGKEIENDMMQCGFNFISYTTLDILNTRLGGVTATLFDIEWTKTSYLSKANRSKFNYSLVEKSTFTLKTPHEHEPMHFDPTDFEIQRSGHWGALTRKKA